MGRVLGDTSACMVTAMAALGDRLGLFKSLATDGPSTADEARRETRAHSRAMCESGWVAWRPRATSRMNPRPERSALPAEHAAVLADEGGPFFVGAAFQLTMPKLQQFDRVAEVFTSGGGVMESEYAEGLWAGPGALQRRLGRTPADPGVDPVYRGPGRRAPPGCSSRGPGLRSRSGIDQTGPDLP